MESRIDWAQFRQNHQNALAAGYEHVHVAIASWNLIEKGSLPENFNGRVWFNGLVNLSFDPKLVGDLLFDRKNENVNEMMKSSISSFVLYQRGEGWKCKSPSRGGLANQCGKTFYPLVLPAECV